MLIWLTTEIWYIYTPKFTDYVSVNKFKVYKTCPQVKYTWKCKWYLKVYVYDFDEWFEKLLTDVLYIESNPIVVNTKNDNTIVVFQYKYSVRWNNMSSYISHKEWSDIFYSINT